MGAKNKVQDTIPTLKSSLRASQIFFAGGGGGVEKSYEVIEVSMFRGGGGGEVFAFNEFFVTNFFFAT